MDCKEQIDKAHQLIEAERYKDAIAHIHNIRKQGCNEAILNLFESLCAYEFGKDLEALQLLAVFLNQSENHEKENYALFTAAICLSNLGLASEAEAIFRSLPDSYPGIGKERANAENQAAAQRRALVYYKQITGADNA